MINTSEIIAFTKDIGFLYMLCFLLLLNTFNALYYYKESKERPIAKGLFYLFFIFAINDIINPISCFGLMYLNGYEDVLKYYIYMCDSGVTTCTIGIIFMKLHIRSHVWTIYLLGLIILFFLSMFAIYSGFVYYKAILTAYYAFIFLRLYFEYSDYMIYRSKFYTIMAISSSLFGFYDIYSQILLVNKLNGNISDMVRVGTFYDKSAVILITTILAISYRRIKKDFRKLQLS